MAARALECAGGGEGGQGRPLPAVLHRARVRPTSRGGYTGMCMERFATSGARTGSVECLCATVLQRSAYRLCRVSVRNCSAEERVPAL